MTDIASLERIDSFAYRHRVSEVMGTPLVTARPGNTIAEAAQKMSSGGISSLVLIDDTGRPVGIVTERDILKAVAVHRSEAADVPLGMVMSSPVATVRSDALAYVAMGRMDRLKVRHLVAVDDKGGAVGMVTVRGLLHIRASSALVVGDEVEVAASAAEMAKAKDKLPRLASELLGEGVDALGIAAVISSVLRDLTARAAGLAERDMAEAGWGEAPAQWCMLLLGSAGRRESLFGADQDNAIIHDGSDGDDPWFAELGKRACDILDVAGIPNCNGGVMARNTEWRHSVDGWERRIHHWIREADGRELLNVHIFVDFRPVYGRMELAAGLRSHLRDAAVRSPRFLRAMAQAAGDVRAPLGVLNQFITKEGRLDLKMSGLLPLTTAARVLALKHGIADCGTGDRLMALAREGHLPSGEAEAFRDSHELMLRVLLEQQLADLAAGLPRSNRVDPRRLNGRDRDRLKAAFKSINALNWLLQNTLASG